MVCILFYLILKKTKKTKTTNSSLLIMYLSHICIFCSLSITRPNTHKVQHSAKMPDWWQWQRKHFSCLLKHVILPTFPYICFHNVHVSSHFPLSWSSTHLLNIFTRLSWKSTQIQRCQLAAAQQKYLAGFVRTCRALSLIEISPLTLFKQRFGVGTGKERAFNLPWNPRFHRCTLRYKRAKM